MGNLFSKSLHQCAAKGDVAKLNQLLAKGAETNELDSNGNTALHIAAAHGHLESVGALLEAGALVDAVNKIARTPLLTAAVNAQWNVVMRLLQAGAEIDSQDDVGSTALAIAVRSGNEAVVLKLLDRSANIEKADIEGKTPLIHAVEADHYKVISTLLNESANADVEDNDGNSPLLIAIRNKRRETVKLLLDYGASPLQKNKELESPLSLALDYSCRNMLGDLIAYVQDEELFQWILHAAPNEKMVSVLVDVAPSILLGPVGEKLLHNAVLHNSTDLLIALLSAGVNKDTLDSEGNSALHHAATNGNFSCVRVLLQAQANPNVQNATDKDTPLHCAARLGCILSIYEILDSPAKVNVINKYGYSPLHLIALKGHCNGAIKLLRRGADKTLKTFDGRTAFDLAMENGYTLCARIIENHHEVTATKRGYEESAKNTRGVRKSKKLKI